MKRNNEDRLMGGHKPTPSEEVSQMPNPMDFVAPTQFVDLPSKGRYPQGHPLFQKDSIEIKYMTAKDEDILTNKSLLKKGIAIDRLIQNLIFDKSISGQSLYLGDRNSILIHARAMAYGSDYKTGAQCPACGETTKFKFDLSDYDSYDGNEYDEDVVKNNNDGTFMVTLPLSKILARIRPMIGEDEVKLMEDSKVKDASDNILTRQMKRFCVSFNGYEDQKTIDYVCDNMVATDSKFLRNVFKEISPDIIMEQQFKCKHCDHEEVMPVPFGTDFFWPK